VSTKELTVQSGDAAPDAGADASSDASGASRGPTGSPNATANDAGSGPDATTDAAGSEASATDASNDIVSAPPPGGGGGCATTDAGAAPDGAAVCGDGWRDPKTEECDDGLKTSTARRGCSAQCQVLDELAVAPTAADAGFSNATRTLGPGRHTIAASDSTFGIVYLEPDRTPLAVSLATFSAKGVPLGVQPFSDGSTVTDQSNPVVAALPCDMYVAAWTDYGGDGDELGVALQLIHPGTTVKGPPAFANQTTASSQFDPDVVFTGSQLVVAWVDDSNAATQPDLRFRTYDVATGVPADEQTLAATADSEADVALAAFAGGWAAAWRDDAGGFETIRVHAGSTDWTVGPAFLPAPAPAKPALVQLDATDLLVVYAVGVAPAADAGVPPASSKIQVALLSTSAPGLVTGVDVPAAMAGAQGLAQSQPNAVNVSGVAVVAWWTEAPVDDPNGEELWLKPVMWDGHTLGTAVAEVPLPRWPQARLGDQRNPALVASTLPPNGALVLGWEDLGRGIAAGEGPDDVVIEVMPVPTLREAGDGGP
jgi:cysteine-rich repeat protein